MEQGCTRFVEVIHRRAGKDRNWLSLILEQMLKKKGTYFHIYPSLNQGKRDCWDNLISDKDVDGNDITIKMIDMFPAEIIISKNETELQIEIKGGSIYKIMGADNKDSVEKMRGVNIAGAVFSEYAHMSHGQMAWDVLRPVLTENGGWAAFVYTPNGENHGKDLYEFALHEPGWFCQLLTVNDTKRNAVGENGEPVITRDKIEAELRQPHVRKEFIEQEYYCSFKGFLHGTIYGDLMMLARAEGRITQVPYIPSLPVGTMWDIGTSDHCVIWFYQLVTGQVRFIDYYTNVRETAPFYAKILRENKRYIYGRMVLPWDAKFGAADYFDTIGFRNINLSEKHSIQTGIDNTRARFSTFLFDENKCSEGISHLESYTYEWDEENRVFKKSPKHDSHSHTADAVRTGIEGGLDPIIFPDQLINMEIKIENIFDPRVNF